MNLKSITRLAAFACFSSFVVIAIQAQQPLANRNSGSISGRITVDGKPKAGLVLERLATDTNSPRRPIAKATTSKSGKYVLSGVAQNSTLVDTS